MKKPPSKEQALFLQKIGEKRTERDRRKPKPKTSFQSNEETSTSREEYKKWKQLSLPEKFCLDNYVQTVEAISEVRESIIREKIYINFDTIREIDTATAMMLAAELEVMKITYKVSQMIAHDSHWDPKVRALLVQMGFLELLSAIPEISSHTEPSKNKIFVKFRSGHKLIGDSVVQILENLQKNITAGELSDDLLLHLCVGISEAITNSYQHAYRGDDRNERIKLNRWWISASIDKQTKEIQVVCYDRGATIPKTIKSSLFPILSEDEIIFTTIKEQKSSTKSKNRGKGLSELLHLIDENKQGTLRIYSGKGMVEFKRSRKKGENTDISRELPRKMQGTLVEWSIIPYLSTTTTETH